MKRRLAAIVSTDIVGYSRLMEADEADTLTRMKAHRAELWTPAIERHGGRVVGTAGDSLLVEYSSAVSAVESAIEVQEGMSEGEAEQTEDTRMLLRVGVNIGEVVVDGDDIFGDGVNVAARLQAIAIPGGICISGKVHDEIEGKLPTSFADAGAHEVKNISRPVQVWRWVTEGQTAASPAKADGPPPLPDKPSIAVLPFDNMSGDPDQEYFADGISEDITTALSKNRSFFVVARNSTFTFKGMAVDVKDVAERMGVRYVLEGSVRKGGNRIRISAQLIEASSGHHVWADRYDRELADIFDLQDEITQTIVAALEPELAMAERERAIRKAPESLDAWQLFQRGMWHHHKFNKQDNAEAARLFRSAIEADPTFAQAYAALAHAGCWDALFGFVDDPDATLSQAAKHSRKALALDDREPYAHFALGRVQMLRAEYDNALPHLRRAVELNPNFAHAHHGLALALILMGRVEEGIERSDLALRLSPFDPAKWTFQIGKARGLFILGRYEESIQWAGQASEQASAGFWTYGILAAAHAHLGHRSKAEQNVDRALQIKPDLDIAFFRRVLPYAVPEEMDIWLSGLRKAGLPE
jgi:adenylate cyclase